jgi:hypothetical protein
MQDAFERWMENPVGMNPLTIKPWHNPQIHWSERIKWLNTDRMREKFQAQPQFEQFVALHLQQLQFLMAPPPMEGGPGPGPGGPGPGAPKETPPVGSGQAMSRSNANSTSTETVPRGNREDNQEQGPV